MQTDHQQAVLDMCPIQRLLERDATVAGLELVLERARMVEQRFGAHVMHRVGNVPEPEIGVRQSLMQGLRRRHRHQTFGIRAPEKNGDPHQFCSFVIPGWSEGPDPESFSVSLRDSGFAVSRRPGMTTMLESQSA